jgi:predicted nuclease of predicted toxin-antitoxin system
LTIITNDVDFSNKILLHEPPPKVIHIRFGNMKMNEFYATMNKLWNDSLELNQTHKLVNVFVDRVEGIN